MKEDTNYFYSRQIRVKESVTDTWKTEAYKIGISKDIKDRTPSATKSEFKVMYQGTDTSKANHEIDVSEIINISATKSFIKKLEEFIKKEYFLTERKCGALTEYFQSYDETAAKFKSLNEILKKYKPDLDMKISGYSSLTDKQSVLHDMLIKDYDITLEKIIAELRKESNKDADNKLSNNDGQIPATHSNNINTPSLKDIYSVLKQDFVLVKDSVDYMLMHKIYHKGRNPKDILGSYKHSVSKSDKTKFQFGPKFNIKYGYDKNSVDLKKAIKIFGSDILDMNDPNFDPKKLPQ